MHVIQSTLNCRGKLVDISRPVVMGILNVTPDSFYDGGKYASPDAALFQSERMLQEGAVFIDVGGMSSRPGAAILSWEEELLRVLPVIEAIRQRFPEALLSVDTVHARVAEAAVEAGAVVVNDISAGSIDPAMHETVARLQVPYVLMHMQGKPADMQLNPVYERVELEILDFFIGQVGRLKELGVRDIIIDPGFGFGKTLQNNYRLLSRLHIFGVLGLPVLAGLSRKSMIYKLLDITPEAALHGTTALHMVALQQGARILRAHDAGPAVETIRLWEALEKAGTWHK